MEPIQQIEPTKLLLHRGAFSWAVETVEPPEARAQVIDLFGTHTLDTAFLSNVHAPTVKLRIELLNPTAKVEIAGGII